MSGSFVIVMGVSGSGKTTLARGLAYAMDRPFAEGDDFHPAANVAKMRAGTPLTDADRRPWLESIRDWMSERAASGQSAVLTCSALTGDRIAEVWAQVLAHREHLGERGLAAKRADQQLDFAWALVRDELTDRLRRSPGVAAIRDDVRRGVLAGEVPAAVAADRLLAAYDGGPAAQ